MSKGGAGKVYFVLYLAVILELLIIFIERDEAEEHLRREQEQALEIVQTILSQLQTGSGAENITAEPKDNIVLDDEKPINNTREYTVIVSVGDPKAVIVGPNGQPIKGDDIPRFEYHVSYISNPELEEVDLGPDTENIEGGQEIFAAALGTEIGSYGTPKQIAGGGAPAEDQSKYFYLNEEKTAEEVAKGHRVKVFSVHFKPNQGAGWYRLRFYSETNKILGLAGGGEPSEDDTIRIGNVKLTVRQLEDVQKALAKKRGSGEDSTEVEKYIHRLLQPGAYKEFPQNKGNTSFDIRVTKPKAQKPADPIAEILAARETIYWYNVAPFSVDVKLGPKEGQLDIQGAEMRPVDPDRNLYAAVIENPSVGKTPITATARNANLPEEVSRKELVVEEPAHKGGIERWRGMRAIIGRPYNPSSDWESSVIPESHYQTVVQIKGSTVLDKSGTSFTSKDLGDDMMIKEGMRPDDIVTTVYWKPNATSDKDKWVPVLSNQPGSNAFLKPGKPMDVRYQSPEQTGEFSFEFAISPRQLKKDLGPITLRQQVAPGQYVGVTANANCEECADYGINARLIQVSDTEWNLAVEADPSKLKPAVNGKRFQVNITMDGRGGTSGFGYVEFTTKIVR